MYGLPRQFFPAVMLLLLAAVLIVGALERMPA